jgi:hypothetical protein
MEGRLGMLVADVHRFFADCVQALRSVHGDDIELVVLFDSVEQIRGTSSTDAERVYASVEALFINYAESLQFEEVHVVYTVPPWLKVRSPGIAGDYDGLQMLPCVRVRNRDGSRCEAGIEALRRVVERRGDWAAVLGTVEALDTIVLASGGYLRDLFRLLQAVLRHARGGELPVGEDTLQLAIHEVRNGYLPIARTDALWLAKVAESHRTELIGHRQADHPTHNLYNLSRFFDYHMVLGYWEDEAWYDVHPLLRDEVRRQAEHA